MYMQYNIQWRVWLPMYSMHCTVLYIPGTAKPQVLFTLLKVVEGQEENV